MHASPAGSFRSVLLVVVLWIQSSLAAAAPANWERLASLPVANGGFIGASLGGEIIVAGGTTWQGDTKLWLDQVWTYAAQRNTWRIAGRLRSPVAYAVSGQAGNSVWFAGGSGGSDSNLSLWRLDLGLQLQAVAKLPDGFVYAAGALIESTLYAVGGTADQAKIDRITNQFWAIDVETGTVARLADYPEASLTTATAAAVGDRLFVFGGARWDAAAKTVVNHATAHAYSVTKKRWEPLPALPHPGRGYCAVTLDERRILLAGGYRNDSVEFVADMYLFDVVTGTYTPTVPLPYAGMVGLVRSGEWLYCVGGEDRKKHRADAVFRIRWAELIKAGR